VLTSRGCPHGCTYCYNHAYRKLCEGKGPAVRRRSVDHVLEELHLLKRSGCRFIRFMDDLFILDEDWIGEFAERYRREIGLGFSCLVRPDYVTEEVVSSLKLAGCYRVMMGIEAGNDRIRRQVLKRNMSFEQIIEAARLIRGAGCKLVTANILAIPGGTFENDWETLELNLRCRPSYASVSILQAYPGTEIHEYAHSLGMIDQHQMTRLSSAFGFSFESDLKFRDEGERRRIEILHKLFPWVVWMPWIAGLARRMVRMRPGRGFELLYLVSVNIGVHLISLPPRIGLPILIRKFGAYLNPWRRRRVRDTRIPETGS
jgi:pyruvate-formate lyase-activating enzyme